MNASPHPYYETQPDGQRVMLRLHGDPYNCFETDMNGTFKRVLLCTLMIATLTPVSTLSSFRLHRNEEQRQRVCLR
jgi:hypothetical protein